jgi:hypothetical protein
VPQEKPETCQNPGPVVLRQLPVRPWKQSYQDTINTQQEFN